MYILIIINRFVNLYLVTPDEQNLRFCVYNIDRKIQEIYSGFIPLSPKSTLRWIGFSDYGSLCFLDSVGVLQILHESSWNPICSVDKPVINNT